jgi:hypothetical protein
VRTLPLREAVNAVAWAPRSHVCAFAAEDERGAEAGFVRLLVA